jgi:hypothetical protein
MHSLQARFKDYLTDSVFTSKAEKSLLKHILANGDACVFGGVIRDFLFNCAADTSHRDIDLVLDELDRPLEKYIQRHLIKRNRFGGYKLNINNKFYDIWTLNDTWAVRQYGKIRRSLKVLPATSFFNVNAIIFSLQQSKFVMHKKFKQSIEQGVLDIVYERNPCPELCIVKAYQLIHELKLCASHRIVQYVETWFSDVRPRLIDIQVSHFGDIKYSMIELERFASNVQATFACSSHSSGDVRSNRVDMSVVDEQSMPYSNRQVCVASVSDK